MRLPVVLVIVGLAGSLASPASAADWPPAASGCGEDGPTKSSEPPTLTRISSTLVLRYTGDARMYVRGTQTAAMTVSIAQAGGRRVGGTPRGGYTCSDPTYSRLALPLNSYGRKLVRRHGRLRVSVVFRIVNGSGVTNTVRSSGVIRPER